MAAGILKFGGDCMSKREGQGEAPPIPGKTVRRRGNRDERAARGRGRMGVNGHGTRLALAVLCAPTV